jgi:hypothetical protein
MKRKLTSIVVDEFKADIASLFCTQHRETVLSFVKVCVNIVLY